MIHNGIGARFGKLGPGALLGHLLLASSTFAQPQPLAPTRLTVHAAAAPTPAMKYKLLPELEDTTPGNAAINYLRALSPEWYTHGRARANPKIYDHLETPLSQMPRKELDWILKFRSLKELDKAARKESCDWQMTDRIREEGIGLLMPDVQSFRELAFMLALRARLQMADGKLDDAVYTLQTGLALGRNVGRGGTLIHYLVGVAICQVMFKQVEDLIQAPGSPNLYWALANLPGPLVDLQKAIQAERLVLLATIPELRDIEKETLTPEKEQKLLEELTNLKKQSSNLSDADARVELTVLSLKIYPEAKKALAAEGRKAEEIDALPVIQVLAIYWLRRFRELQDDHFKWINLPFPEARRGLVEAERLVIQAHQSGDALPFSPLLPVVEMAHLASGRVARRIAGLRCLEAIRMHAKDNGGQLPKTLDDIVVVPVPFDPMTGKPFEYQVKDSTITLCGPLPGPGKVHPGNALLYEMTLEKGTQTK